MNRVYERFLAYTWPTVTTVRPALLRRQPRRRTRMGRTLHGDVPVSKV